MRVKLVVGVSAVALALGIVGFFVSFDKKPARQSNNTTQLVDLETPDPTYVPLGPELPVQTPELTPEPTPVVTPEPAAPRVAPRRATPRPTARITPAPTPKPKKT